MLSGHLRAAVAYEGLQEWTISAEKYREVRVRESTIQMRMGCLCAAGEEIGAG